MANLVDPLANSPLNSPSHSTQHTEINDALQTLGVWQTWTPTVTGITLGNGTIEARYTQYNKTVAFTFVFTLGSTSAITGEVIVPLPVNRRTTTQVGEGTVLLRDAGTANYVGFAFYPGGNNTQVLIRYLSVGGSVVAPTSLSSTTPFTWGNTDQILLSGTYEAA